jgi:hypothetical protein
VERIAMAKPISPQVKTEARRIARGLIKDELKRLKVKISCVEAKSITKAVNALLKQRRSIYATARRNVKS